jgi:hypothetical protein
VDKPQIEPLGFGTTDLNGDASFSDAYQGIVIVFQAKAETMICHGDQRLIWDCSIKLRFLEIIKELRDIF